MQILGTKSVVQSNANSDNPENFQLFFLAYFVLRGAESLELGLVVVEARVLGHEVVVCLIFVVFPQPVVAAKG